VSSVFDYSEHGPLHGREGFELFAARDPADSETLVGYMERRRFSPGETVLVGGEPDRSLYVLTDGTLEVTVKMRNGSKRTAQLESGAVFGEVGFFDGRPRSATVRGVTAGEMLRLGFEHFEALAADHPELGRALLVDLGTLLASRLRGLEALQ
jgi:CRP-like cAMP-binding protein